MSSIATFFRTLPDTLQQPVALAMLGSLGAHLIVFATLPAFTSSSEPRPEAEVRRVRRIDPPQGDPRSQIARSPLGLPPIPNTPNTPNRTIQLPNAGSGNSPLPNPLYTIPDLTPVPVPNPPQPQFSSQDRFNELLRRLAARQQQQQRQAQANNTPPKPPQPKPDPQFTTTPLPNLNQQNPADIASKLPPSSGETPSAPLPTPTGTPVPTPTTPASPRVDQAQLDRNNQLLAESRYIAEGTTQQEGLQAQANLTEQLNTKFPEAWEYVRLRQPGEPIREIDYPLAFSLQNYQQHPAAIAVFVGKDGKPLPDQKPVILNSTGYQILNNKAIEIVQKDAAQPNRFPAIDQDKVRVFVYEFKFKAPNTQQTS